MKHTLILTVENDDNTLVEYVFRRIEKTFLSLIDIYMRGSSTETKIVRSEDV